MTVETGLDKAYPPLYRDWGLAVTVPMLLFALAIVGAAEENGYLLTLVCSTLTLAVLASAPLIWRVQDKARREGYAYGIRDAWELNLSMTDAVSREVYDEHHVGRAGEVGEILWRYKKSISSGLEAFQAKNGYSFAAEEAKRNSRRPGAWGSG